jgi:ferrous iron transport protein A
MLAELAPPVGTGSLAQQPIGRAATVARVSAPAHAPEWADWLADLGFIPGERVMVTARSLPGGDPLAVRIGSSTFALRRAEAACVQVVPDPAAP